LTITHQEYNINLYPILIMLLRLFASRLFFIIFICSSILFPIVYGLYEYYVNTYYVTVYHSTNSGLYGCEFTLLTIFSYWLLCLLLFGIFIFLIGIGRFIYEKTKKIKSSKTWQVKILIIKGLIAIILSFVLFYIIMWQGPYNVDPFSPLPKCVF